jgi:hypothetical protein
MTDVFKTGVQLMISGNSVGTALTAISKQMLGIHTMFAFQ